MNYNRNSACLLPMSRRATRRGTAVWKKNQFQTPISRYDYDMNLLLWCSLTRKWRLHTPSREHWKPFPIPVLRSKPTLKRYKTTNWLRIDIKQVPRSYGRKPVSVKIDTRLWLFFVNIWADLPPSTSKKAIFMIRYDTNWEVEAVETEFPLDWDCWSQVERIERTTS